jgi:hypothetical protein
VIEAKFDRVWSFSEGIDGMNLGGYWKGKWGFIDKKGKYIGN